MEKAKTTKHALFKSAFALLICFAMLISSTFAWFTDEVTSAGNKIQSGTLKVDLELLDKETGVWHSIKQTKAPIFDYDLWEPGYVDTKILKVENEGNLALKWVAQFYSENELSILADVIDVYVCSGETELQYPESRDLEGYTCVGNLRKFINTIEETTYGTLEAGAAAYLGIALKMQESAGNEYQGLSLGGAFDIRIFATQYTSESDSFNNMYDILADESIYASQSKTLENGASSVDFTLSDKGVVIAKVSVPASAIADTSKPVKVTFDGIDPSKTITVGENTKAYAYDIDVTNLKENLSGNQLVTVVVTAPNALAAMKAYHNGVLIKDAVYDEVKGTVTFKTASFSPFAFTTQVYTVTTLADLREELQIEGAYVKLEADLTVNLAATGGDRSEDHKFTSTTTGTVMYNGVNINGKNVAIDLNGHKITAKCGRDSLNTTGALFFVAENGSLNLLDSATNSNGYIKMENSMYMVWAPFAGDSYMDIYSGAFIADSYAGDAMATPGSTTYFENDNRALVYAGTGGNMNIYGGYFLYNNTPNDKTDRNNGAFNVSDLTQKVCITIHPGAKLINAQYKQDPTYTTLGQKYGYYYDAYSIKLKNGCTLQQTTDNVTIDGKAYNTWYTPVQSGPEVWNPGFFSIGQTAVNPDAGAAYYYFAVMNYDCYGKNGEKATGFVKDGLKAENNYVAYNYQITDPATGLGSMTVTGVTKDTPLGFTGSYISFKEYENIDFGYYVDGDLSTFVRCTVTSGNQTNGTYVTGKGTNCHNFGTLLVDKNTLSSFEAGSNHKITWAVQAVKIVKGQNVAYETVDLCQWKITMAGSGTGTGSGTDTDELPEVDENAQFTDTNKPNINVIILAGQSNATGFSPITQDIRSTYGRSNFSNVKIRFKNLGDATGEGNFYDAGDYLYKNDNFETYKLGIGGVGTSYFGPELGVANYLSTQRSNEQWAIIKYAPSGSSLGGNWFGNAKLADDMISYVKESIDLLDDTYDVNIRGFLWMQGETDSIDAGFAGAYQANEQKLVTLVRRNFAQYATRATSAPNEPGSGIAFIDASIAPLTAADKMPYARTVNNGKALNCSLWYLPTKAAAGSLWEGTAAGDYQRAENEYAISNSVYIDTAALISKADATNEHQYYPTEGDKTEWVHYCAASMDRLGQWFGNALGKTLN